MAMKIPVSFKETEKVLFDYTTGQLSPSIYIKQLIKDDMEKKKERNCNDKPFASNKPDFDF